MRKIMLVCCLLIGLTVVTQARPQNSFSSDPLVKAKGLQRELRLSDAQTHSIASIYTDSERKFERIKNHEHGDTNKMMEQIRPLRVATVRKIKAVLTRRQRMKYEELLKQGNSQSVNGGWADGWGS